MSISNHMSDRLRKLYRIVLIRMAGIEAALAVPASFRKVASMMDACPGHRMEPLEPRVLLSSSGTAVSDHHVDQQAPIVVEGFTNPQDTTGDDQTDADVLDYLRSSEATTPDVVTSNADIVTTNDLAGTSRVSVSSDGTLANSWNGSSSISADGRYVSFTSGASNLVPDDTNGWSDIFVYDRQTNQIERVSVASDGTQGNWNSTEPSISADGRFVSFVSSASNLVSDTSPGHSDIFVHDRQTGQTERVSVSSDGTPGNGHSSTPSISADGRYVSFQSAASNLVTGDTNQQADIFVYDRATNQIERVNVASDDTQGQWESGEPSISADGRYVAFESRASNLVPDDTNDAWDIFVYDRQTDQLERVSVGSEGTQANERSDAPSISADGRYVSFESDASNLVPGDTNNASDIFVYDRQTNLLERVSVTSDGQEADWTSEDAAISADGRFVSFVSVATNLAPDDINSQRDVFVYDRQTQEIQRVSVTAAGTPPNKSALAPSISADGRFVSYESRATNLVLGDTNNTYDVFVIDRGTPDPAAQEVEVRGNQWIVFDNDSTPEAVDHTDFGTVTAGDTPVSRTFTVLNTGSQALTTSSLSVPTGFTVTEGLSSSIAAGESDTFTVRMDTNIAGTKSGQISFDTNDSDESTYNFAIAGVVSASQVTSPEVEVKGNDQIILDNDVTPDASDHTDFGTVTTGDSPVSHTFTVFNTGDADLTTSDLSVPAGFTITDGLASSIAAGESDTFTIRMDTAVVGTKLGSISFTTNDTDESLYNFSITGVVSEVQVVNPEVEVKGNDLVIVDNDTTPYAADHTDFGSVTTGDSPVSRTFTVFNIGDAELVTSDLSVPTGFTITEELASTIAAGESDTFTVRMDTDIAGTKSGQISFTTNDSDENPYNFSITGSVTEVQVTSPEIEVKGNDLVIVDNDTRPDASDHTDFGTVTTGGTPISRTFTVFNIGDAELITSDLSVPTGFTITEGLASTIAAGESDTLTIRMDTDVAGTKTGQISFTTNDGDENPYNFSITGTVTDAQVTSPEIEVKGNDQLIVDNDTSSDASDHTDFGTVTTGDSPVSRTFTVFNTGDAELITSDLSVPTGFTITEGLANTIAAGESDTFTVRMDTAVVGTKSGQVSFTTNDSDENIYNFTITGTVNQPVLSDMPNLTASLDDRHIPAAIVTGTSTRVIVPITVSNHGNIATEPRTTIDIQIYARPDQGGDDVLVTTLTNQNVASLRPGTARRLNAVFTLPAEMASNDYVFVARLDSQNVVAESNQNDNDAVGTKVIEIAQGHVNLTATLDDRRIPTSIVAGTTTRMIMPITVSNDGNIALEPRTTIDIDIYARPVAGGDDVLVATLTNQNISSLRPGTAKRLNAVFTLPAEIDTNDYVLAAVVDSQNVVDESNETDNDALGTEVVAIAEGHVNLTATLDDRRIPTSIVAGTTTRMIVPITVSNEGNIALEPRTTIDIEIHARPVAGGDDVLVATLTNQNVSSLRPGTARRLNAVFTLPAEITSDNYVLVAVVDSQNVVDESNEADNDALGTEVVAIAEGHVNLTATLDDRRIPTSIVAGTSTRMIVPITVSNEGNIALAPRTTINIDIYARPVGGGDDVLVATLTNQNVSSLRPGTARRLNAVFTLPAEISSDNYVLVANVDSQNVVDESKEADNDAVGTEIVAIAEGHVNLTATLDDRRIPTSIVAGTTTRMIVPITVSNEGNIALEPRTTIDIEIFARPVGGGDDVLVTTLTNQNVSSLRPGTARRLNAVFTLPAEIDTNDYVLAAVVDSLNVVEESNEADNDALGTEVVAIAEGHVNLTATLDDRRIPTSIVAGTTTRMIVPITVSNEGNIALEPRTTIDIEIFARPVGGGDDVLVTTLTNQNVSSLRPGTARRLNAVFTLPAEITSDNYLLVANVDSQNVVAESNEADNDAVGTKVIEIAEGHVNLTATLDDRRIPTSIVAGTTTRMIVPVTVSNEGNIALEPRTTIDIDIYARPVAGGDDVLVTTLTNQNVSSLRPGTARRLNAVFTLPAEIDTNDYLLVANVDSQNVVDESNEADNTTAGTEPFEVQWLAPASLADFHLDAIVRSGSDPFASRGRFSLAVSSAGDAYLLAGDGRFTATSQGVLSYERISSNQAVVTYSDSITGDAEFHMDFTSATQASYTIQQDLLVVQSGTLRLSEAQQSLAPDDLVGRSGLVTIRGGTDPFASSGRYQINFEDTTYSIVGQGNVASSTGTYVYESFSNDVGFISIDDSLIGEAAGGLLFTRSNTADFIMLLDTSWQTGTIRL